MRLPPIRCLAAGDLAILAELGDTVSLEVHHRVRRLFLLLESNPLAGIREAIPAYRSILIFYDPLRLSPRQIENHLLELDQRSERHAIAPPSVVEIPVCYGGEYGPDLESLADYHHLTPQQVISLHSSPDYLVYLVGFSPGFPFLGGLDERLHTPRLDTPRSRVPPGSVAIANQQTGIYPIESPGGWRIIGRTPIALYRPDQEPPVLARMGDVVRFKPISSSSYKRLHRRKEG